MDLTEKDKEEPARKRRETGQVLDPVRIVGKKRRNNDDGILEEDCKNVLLDDPTTATVSDPVIESSAKNEVEQSGAQLLVLEEACLFTSSDISTLFDGSVSSSLGSMRPLGEKLDKLLAPAQEYYRRLPKRTKEGMHLLKDDVEVISSYLDELSEVEDPPPMAMCWMNEARDLSYDMEDYIDSLLFVPPDRFFKKKKKKGRRKKMMIKKMLKWYKQVAFTAQVSEHGIMTSKIIHVNVPRLPSKPKIAETISEFRIYVQEAIERHNRYKLHCCSNLRRRTFLSTGRMLPMPYEETDDHVVIDGQMNEFINSLAANDAADQQQLKVVSVLGTGCLGKTTLAKVLYNRIGMQFDCRAFIRVSKKPDMKRLLRDLFSQLHQKKQPLPTNCNELGISDINIRKHLQDKRYLIVIDDLWDASVWDIIKSAFPKGNRGSRIIITTQIEDVASTCCCDHSEHVFEMKPLDDDHSRKLFFSRLFGSESDCPEELKQVSNEIVDICGGLPLATINIASHLANQETEVSMDLLAYTRDALRSYLWSNSTSERTKQVLNLSYNNLPHYLKTCLLYLNMHPEGSIICKDDAVKQWVVEGFIAPRKGKEQGQDWMEKVAGIYFDELIDRRFIQPLYINYNNKSAEENFIVVVDYNRKNIALTHKVRRLSLIFGDGKYAKTPENITKSQVRSLRYFGLFKCMPCIREFKVLRVLNLILSGHCGDYDPIDLTGISELFQLRYLKIASDVCIKLPNSMRGLKCLETLDVMDATRVTAVPWDIIQLPHLLHLILPVDTNLLDLVGNLSDSVIHQWSLGKLNCLQDLHLTFSSTSPDDHLETSMEVLAYLIGGHGNLKTVVIAHGSLVENTVVPGASKVIPPWYRMAPPPLLQRLEFSPHSCCIFSRIPPWIEKHGNLCILKIPLRELKMICIDTLGGLCALTALSLYVETPPIQKIIFDKAVGFSVLKHFKLRFTTGIACLKFEEDAMPNLLKLKLVFNAIPPMGQPFFFRMGQVRQKVQHEHGTAVISIEHMPGLREISTKFGGTASDLEYASRTVVSNHPSNPTIKMQLVGYSSNVDRSTKQKQQPDDILEEQPDGEYDKRLERSADQRISTSLESNLRLDVPEITPTLVQITGGGDDVREHMFDKVVTASDVGKLNRLVVPNQFAEKYFPLDVAANEKGLLLNFEDRGGKLWNFRYSYSNNSQSYIMTMGWSAFVRDHHLATGDTVSFYRAGTRLFIDCRVRGQILAPVTQAVMPASASPALK
uniref:B3 domain-containing protein n=1 Tax=Aegilops tauschii TaxID=37682 RepID=M8D0F0_AEGTA